jgi:hypothetical protein
VALGGRGDEQHEAEDPGTPVAPVHQDRDAGVLWESDPGEREPGGEGQGQRHEDRAPQQQGGHQPADEQRRCRPGSREEDPLADHDRIDELEQP